MRLSFFYFFIFILFISSVFAITSESSFTIINSEPILKSIEIDSGVMVLEISDLNGVSDIKNVSVYVLIDSEYILMNYSALESKSDMLTYYYDVDVNNPEYLIKISDSLVTVEYVKDFSNTNLITGQSVFNVNDYSVFKLFNYIIDFFR